MGKEFGKHYLVEFVGCDRNKLEFVVDVKTAFLRAAEKSRAGIIEHHFHQFKPCGVSGVILIEWSHFALHTWPEDSYAAFDVFTCGEMCPEIAIEELKKSFRAEKAEVKIFSRGF